MGTRPNLFPYPNGWYLLAVSDELARGRVLTRQFMGQEIVLFRTESGVPCAVEAYCAHLGAHLGIGGKVHGETIQCPFHGFRYDGAGACVATGYGSPVPPKAKLKTWHVREQNGFVFGYHHNQGEAPVWDIPVVNTDGWTRLIHKTFILRDHPQETTENSVDLGHFAFVHNYRDVHMVKEFESDGPYLSTAYAVKRGLRMLGVEVTELDFTFETEIYGLGYSMVNVSVPRFRVLARLWVLPTTMDEERLTLTLAVRVKKWSPPIGMILSPLVGKFILDSLAHDAGQDFPIWENKRYTDPPALAKGDGPIGKYRQWAKQFYP